MTYSVTYCITVCQNMQCDHASSFSCKLFSFLMCQFVLCHLVHSRYSLMKCLLEYGKVWVLPDGSGTSSDYLAWSSERGKRSSALAPFTPIHLQRKEVREGWKSMLANWSTALIEHYLFLKWCCCIIGLLCSCWAGWTEHKQEVMLTQCSLSVNGGREKQKQSVNWTAEGIREGLN